MFVFEILLIVKNVKHLNLNIIRIIVCAAVLFSYLPCGFTDQNCHCSIQRTYLKTGKTYTLSWALRENYNSYSLDDFNSRAVSVLYISLLDGDFELPHS
jgi:hypothetical protein